jgi:hypothetical protein
MQKTLILLLSLITASFGVQANKIPVHAWLGGPGKAIKASIKNGATGICLFTPDRMTEEHWKIFIETIH